MYKLVFQAGKIEKPDWIENMGNFNNLPTPFQEESEKEFQAIFSTYSPEYIDFRQVQIADPDGHNKHTRDVHIFFFCNVAFAMVHPTPGQPTRYFRIGCHHVWEGMTEQQMKDLHIPPLDRYEHISICNRCGSIHRVDSSD